MISLQSCYSLVGTQDIAAALSEDVLTMNRCLGENGRAVEVPAAAASQISLREAGPVNTTAAFGSEIREAKGAEDGNEGSTNNSVANPFEGFMPELVGIIAS